MPGQQGVRSNDRGHIGKRLVAQLLGPNRQTAVLLVIESQPPITELLPQDPILFAEIVNDVLLLLVEPAGERNRDEA